MRSSFFGRALPGPDLSGPLPSGRLFASLAAMIAVAGCAAAAWLMAWLFHEPLGAMILGTAPGGVAEMSLTGKVLGMDVALIVTLHVTRIFLVTVLTPPAFRLLHHRNSKT